MAAAVKLLVLSVWGLVLFLSLRSFYQNSLVTGVLLGILSLPLLSSASKRSLKLPPGPNGFPILGYLPFLGERPHFTLAKLAQKYGPVMYIQMGSFDGIVVDSAQFAKEVLMTQDHNFASRPNSFVTWAKYFAYYNRNYAGVKYNMGTSNPGSLLRHLRRLMIEELQATKRLQFFKNIRTEEIDAMMQGFVEEVKEGKQIVDLRTAINDTAMNNLTRMIIRKRYYSTDLSAAAKKEAEEFQGLLREVLILGITPFIQDFIPSLRPVMSFISTQEHGMAKLGKVTDAFFQSIVDEHRRQQNTIESTQDFVDVMLQSVGEDNKPLDDKVIKSVTLEMFFAGAESTIGALEWAVAELLHQPRFMQQLQEELDTVIGASRMAQESDIPNLKFLKAVVNETFRLHPIAPLLLPHSNSMPTQLGGYDIPANSHVMVNVWSISRDPSLWEDPITFNPNRFMTMDKEINYKGQDFQLLPFGAGRRKCPGMHSAALMVHITLARLVHGFSWSLPEGMTPDDMDMSETSGFNTSMKSQLLRVCCEARLPLELYYQTELA